MSSTQQQQQQQQQQAEAAATEPPIEVAVLLSDAKERKLRLFDRVAEAGDSLAGIRFSRVDLDDLLDQQQQQQQLRYRVVLHKMHADLASTEPAAVARVRRFKAWSAAAVAAGRLVLLDPLEGLESMLLHRLDQCDAMARCAEAPELLGRVYVPRYALVSSATAATPRDSRSGQSLRYPLVCKPQLASGAAAHDMTLVFAPEQLAQLSAAAGEEAGRLAVVAQEFVNHGARIIKVYVLGSRIHACVRPSIRDFPPGYAGPAIQFSSHAVSKAGCQSELSKPSSAAPDGGDNDGRGGGGSPESDAELLARFADLLQPLADRCRSVLGLDLINIDLVPDGDRLAMVDVNQFPGYEAMPGYVLALAELIRQKCGCGGGGGGSN